MIENDNLQKFMFENAPVRGEYIHLSASYQTILAQHAYPPAIQQLLGEALCAAGLLTALIKFNGRLSVQFRGSGKLKMLLAQCNQQFHLRGLVKWDGELTYDELMDSFKEGVLSIMLNSSTSTQTYQGVVNWKGHSLAESLEGYFRDSEQLATRIWLSVNQYSAAGLLLQAMPEDDVSQHTIQQEVIEMEWQRLAGVLGKMQQTDLLGMGIESLLYQLYPEEDVRVFDPQPVEFRCTCTRARGEEAILMLGPEEAEDELRSKKQIVVTCDFCNKDYVYDKVDVASIFANRGSSNNADLH